MNKANEHPLASPSQAPLTVYKASAGSGKTFRLAVEYIKLLIENPAAYRHILAVTFTNKATEEMKLRILSQLYGISRQLPDSRPYLDVVTSELGVSPQMAVKRAGEALTLLLHGYHGFRVGTIDSFFQNVLRNLAREMDLAPNLNVTLDGNQEEERAVDELIDELQDRSTVMGWILDYIRENINDDKTWNVIRAIKTFGRFIFNDDYKSERQALERVFNDDNFFPRYIKQLRRIRTAADEMMKECSEQFEQRLARHQLTPADLKNGNKGIASYFRKLGEGQWNTDKVWNKTAADCSLDATNWATKTAPRRAEIVAVAQDELMPLLLDAERMRLEQVRRYNSADLTLKNLNHLRLLGAIEARVQQNMQDEGRFLLSDTQTFLHRLIDGSDTPFIFEKIGATLEHIMIDEFQDTGTVQWKNFSVLLRETMSRGSNLIVGDVKQSIYRWRGGDWQLLNGIEDLFDEREIRIDTLRVNRRSARRIIGFNNRFFQTARQLEWQRVKEVNPEEADRLLHAYDGVEQEVPEGKPDNGFVSIELLPKENYNDAVLERTVAIVDDLMARGAPLRDVCILVRENKYIPLIAQHFMDCRPEVPVVSNEAFRLDASLAVNTLVNGLYALTHPTEPLYEQTLRRACERINGTCDVVFPLDPSLRTRPLIDIVERLYALFHVEQLRNEGAYVCAFYDEVNGFLQDMGGDIEAFLRAWEDGIGAKTIQSDSTNGLQIISIHKSKGLEFDHVIVPFCDWKINRTDGTLWCKPSEAPFNELPLVPVNYNSKMIQSIYADDYKHEFMQNVVDGLNLLYVAFTRAGCNLFVIGRRDDTSRRSHLLQQVVAQWQPEEGDAAQPIVYRDGTLLLKPPTANKASANVFTQPAEPVAVALKSYDAKVEFLQSNESRRFVADEEGETNDDALRDHYIKMGNVMHALFSTIRTADDLPRALQQLELSGVLYDENITADRLHAMLQKRMNTPRVARWFEPRWTLYNECTLITRDAEGVLREKRPDRVMTDSTETIVVDFKFGRPKDAHIDQVRGYIKLLADMGMPRVSGCLWYVYTNEIVDVEP